MTVEVMQDGASKDAYVIGVDWKLAVSGSDASKFVRGQALALGARLGAGQVVSTLPAAFARQQPRKRLLSATALVAAVERNAVVCHSLEDGRFWIAAVKDGAPLPGCDSIVPAANALHVLREYLGFVPDAAVIGTDADSVFRVEDVFRKASRKQCRAAAYKKPRHPLMPLVVFATAAVLIAAGATTVRKVQVARRAAEQVQQAALARLTDAKRTDAMVAKYEADAKRAVDTARKELAETAPAQAQVSAWLNVVLEHPLASNGFRLDKAECDVGQCKLTWRALPYAALDGPVLDDADVVERDDTMVVTAHRLHPIEKISRGQEERVALASRFHRLGTPIGLAFTLSSPSTPIVVPLPPIPDAPDDAKKRMAAIQPVTIGHQSEVTVSTPLSLALESAELLGHAVTAKSMEIGPLTTPSGGAQSPLFRMKGTHVRLA